MLFSIKGEQSLKGSIFSILEVCITEDFCLLALPGIQNSLLLQGVIGWDNFPWRGVQLNWIRVGHGPAALAVGAGGGVWHFSLAYHFSFVSPSLCETARYRPKYNLKGPKTTNQPTNLYYTWGGGVVRWCWVSFQYRGILLIWSRVEQGLTAPPVGAGGGCLDIFSFVYHFSFLSPSGRRPDID